MKQKPSERIKELSVIQHTPDSNSLRYEIGIMKYLDEQHEAEQKKGEVYMCPIQYHTEIPLHVMIVTPTKETTEWEERFDEQFYEGDQNSVHCRKHKFYATPFEIKRFISKERQNAKEEVLREILEENKKNGGWGHNPDFGESIFKKLSSLTKS